MNPLKEKEYQQIVEEAAITSEEMDQACEAFATQDQKEKAKALTSKVIYEYSGFLNSVSQTDKMEAVRALGPQIANIEDKLACLQEAPE